MRNSLAAGAQALGATIMRRNRVTGVTRLTSGEFRVETEQGDVICEHVVNAAGCYAREVGRWLGVDTPITNMEHQYLVTEPLAEFKDSPVELPVMRDPATAGYYRQEQKAGLVGIYEHRGAREAWASRGGLPDWSSENELFEGDLDRIAPWLEKALERMPIFANAGIKRIINGAIPHTPDGNPLVDNAGRAKCLAVLRLVHRDRAGGRLWQVPRTMDGPRRCRDQHGLSRPPPVRELCRSGLHAGEKLRRLRKHVRDAPAGARYRPDAPATITRSSMS